MLCVNMMHFSSFITRTWMVGWPLKCPLIYVGKLTVSTQLIKKKLIVFHSPYFEMVPLFSQWLSLSLRDHFDFHWDHFDYRGV